MVHSFRMNGGRQDKPTVKRTDSPAARIRPSLSAAKSPYRLGLPLIFVCERNNPLFRRNSLQGRTIL
jgi:hypothetical protein